MKNTSVVVRMLIALTSLIGLLLLAALVPGPHGKAPQPTLGPPQPTQVVSIQEREERSGDRDVWWQSLHRADADTDWQEVERGNWRRFLRDRHRLLAEDGVRERLQAAPLIWKEIGSMNQAGRVHQAAYDETNGKLLVGSSLGGVWQSDFDATNPTPDAMSWEPIADHIYGSAFQVLLLDGLPQVVIKTYASAWFGEVHRSDDGGATWTVVPGIQGRSRRLLKLADAQQTVFVVADDPNQWYSGPATTRLYRSLDRGASFQEIRNLSSYRGDIWAPRTGDTALYLLANNRLEMSTDRGNTWTVLGSLAWAGDSKVTLAGSEAGAPTFYAVVERIDGVGGRKMFRSTDGGLNWTAIASIDDYWGDLTSLAASTTNPDLVLYGGINAHRSINGGASFQPVNDWSEYYGTPAEKLHADITSIDFTPLAGGGELLFISTDGGLFFSDDGGLTVTNLSLQGLRISQYYSVLTDKSDESRIMAGSQDQGFQVGPASDGIFDQVISGDYGHLTSSDGTHDIVYATYPGFLLIAESAGGATQLVYADFPAGETYQWLPFILADPLDRDSFYFCASHLHKYQRSGSEWIGSQMGFNFAVDANEFVTALAIAPSDPNRWYAGTNFGRFWYSIDGGVNWNLSSFADVPAPHYLTGMAILVNKDNPADVIIGGSGYSNPAVYRSWDGGQSFGALGASIPSTLVYDLASDPEAGGDVYAATESGPFKYEASSGSWESILGLGAPMTTYWSVESLSDRVRFGTFGRGIWDYVVSQTVIFTDGFESGDTSSWSSVSF